MQRSPQISVIVCTFNRSSLLERCLAHLAVSASQFDAPWELVVVDNGSTDGTPSTLDRWKGRLPTHPLREDRRGLSVARNTGLQAASGRIVAFVDDDCFVSAGWLAAIVTAYAAPGSTDGIGGRVRLWDHSDWAMSIRDFPDPAEVTDLQGIQHRLIGCNFTARIEALREVGGFDERLGAGTRAKSAEDFDLFYRMLRAGLRLSYEPAIEVFHAHGRRSKDQVASLMRGYLVGRGAWYAKHAARGDRTVIKTACWELRSLMAHAMRPSRHAASPEQFALSPTKVLAALAHGAFLRLGERLNGNHFGETTFTPSQTNARGAKRGREVN